jgi:hypothetical protein
MLMIILIALQVFQVAVLWLHDWLPLGRLNDVPAVRAADSFGRLVRVTLIQSVPYTLGLIFTVRFEQTGHPHWVFIWLWISYGLLFAGELRAWWVPYLLQAEPARAARYAGMFGATHSFLPPRNGITPNTLHCALHAATFFTLVVLTVI